MRDRVKMMASAAVVCSLVSGLSMSAVAAGKATGRPSAGRTRLTPPDGASDANASARLDVKHFPANRSRLDRSWFRVKVRHLDAATGYTLWADDPSTPEADLVQFDSFTTGDEGEFNYTQDTKLEGTLPFGATLADLSGLVVEVRDSAGTTTLLVGTIPTTTP